MGQVLHRGATTTAAIRRAIQHSQESLRALVSMASTPRRWPSGGSGALWPIFPRNPESPDLRFLP